MVTQAYTIYLGTDIQKLIKSEYNTNYEKTSLKVIPHQRFDFEIL